MQGSLLFPLSDFTEARIDTADPAVITLNGDNLQIRPLEADSVELGTALDLPSWKDLAVASTLTCHVIQRHIVVLQHPQSIQVSTDP